MAPGNYPPLVLDSAFCQVNPNCSLPEAVQLPTVSDVCASFQPSEPRSMWIGASLDFKADHKQVKVREQDLGLLPFEFARELYGYVVCHLGAHSYWWQRLGALLLRISHSLPAQQPHKAWLYVDGLLANLLRRCGDLQIALLVVLLVCLKSLLEKGSLRGLYHLVRRKFNFRSETVSLEPKKLLKLAEQIQDLLAQKKVHKKASSPAWACSTGKRPLLAVISHHLRALKPHSTRTCAARQALCTASLRASGKDFSSALTPKQW